MSLKLVVSYDEKICFDFLTINVNVTKVVHKASAKTIKSVIIALDND